MTTTADQTTVETSLVENATGPRKAAGDGQSFESHSLADQILAAKYLAGRDASKIANRANSIRGMFNKLQPPGTV